MLRWSLFGATFNCSACAVCTQTDRCRRHEDAASTLTKQCGHINLWCHWVNNCCTGWQSCDRTPSFRVWSHMFRFIQCCGDMRAVHDGRHAGIQRLYSSGKGAHLTSAAAVGRDCKIASQRSPRWSSRVARTLINFTSQSVAFALVWIEMKSEKEGV